MPSAGGKSVAGTRGLPTLPLFTNRNLIASLPGGGHGLEVRTEGGEQFLYVTGFQQLKNFAKLTLKSETVWEKRAPMEAKLYPEGEDTKPAKRWGRDAFMPANIDSLNEVLLVPDLSARITLLDKNDQVIVHLGEDPEWRAQVLKENMKLRGNATGDGWVSGKFLHPHDACFDPAGNIFVAEWVNTGRITRLRKVSGSPQRLHARQGWGRGFGQPRAPRPDRPSRSRNNPGTNTFPKPVRVERSGAAFF